MDASAPSAPTQRRPGWARVVGLCALAVAVILAVRVALRRELEPKAAFALLRSIQHQWWALPAFGFAYLTLTAAFVPVVLFHMISGAVYGFPVGLAVNLVVFNVTVSLQFLAARRMGRAQAEALVTRYNLGGLVNTSSTNGLRTVLSLRVVPLPSIVTCLAAVLAGVRWRDFALGSFIGGMPSTVIFTYFAASLVEGAAGAERKALVQTAIAGACIALLALGPKLLQRLRRPSAQGPTTPT